MADANAKDSGEKLNGKTNSDDLAEDKELAALLESALQDFSKPQPLASASGADGPFAAQEVSGASGGSREFEGGLPYDPAIAQHAAAEFQKMLKSLAEVQNAVHAQVEGESSAEGDSAGPGAANAEEAAVFSSFLANLGQLANKAQTVKDAKSDAEIEAAMQSLQGDETFENDFLPFMQGLVGSLLSKEMLYPSLKEMTEKYPSWLEANKDKVPAADFERYQRQNELMQRACAEYETEKEDEPEEAKGRRLEALIIIMQEMQTCGQPPQEIGGSLPPGWEVDETNGLPKMADPNVAAESCSIM